jgi:hypothetical protein
MSRYQSEPHCVTRLRGSHLVTPVPIEPTLLEDGAIAVDDAMIIREMREAIGAGEIRRAMAWMIYLRDQPVNATENAAASRPR